MKKLFYLLLLFAITTFTSCKKDDEIPELPPTEVSNIDVAVLEGTRVRISWKESTDPNGDEIHYDVVVNNVLVSDEAKGGSIEYDVVSLMSKASRKNLKKGVNLSLNIKIRAFDTKNNVSDTVEVNRSVFVNRNPEAFDFIDIYFDTYNYDGIEIYWNEATDPDGDILSYDVYVNDKKIKSNYVLGSNNNQGYVSYRENFYNEAENDITIKVVAKDPSGGESEISKTFNFRGTDEDLGTLSIPHEESHDFSISNDEPDNRLGFKFTISESTGLSVYNQEGFNFMLRNSNGNIISSGYNKMFINTISAGTYTIEVDRNFSNTSGTFILSLRDSQATDVNLGALTIPYETTQNFDATKEPDNKIAYTFSVTESTGVFIKEQGTMNYYNLKTPSGNYLGSGYDNLTVANISAGDYVLEIENNQNPNASFTLKLEDATLTDVDLGELTIPYQVEQTFIIDSNELDNKIGYKFSITESTGLSIFATNQNNYTLKDINGNYYTNGHDRINYENLPAGSYILEVEKGYNSNSSGKFTLTLNDPSATDIDLGVIATLPFSESYDITAINYEADNKITYKIEVTEQSDYNFNTNAQVYMNLLDSHKNYISSSYQSLSGTITNPGVYYIEIYWYGYTVNGNLNINLD